MGLDAEVSKVFQDQLTGLGDMVREIHNQMSIYLWQADSLVHADDLGDPASRYVWSSFRRKRMVGIEPPSAVRHTRLNIPKSCI